MDGKPLALAVLVYVTLDFANPLMPGAVRFDGGSVTVVDADRARSQPPGTPVELLPTPEAVVDRPVELRVRRSPRPGLEARHRGVVPIRRAPPSSEPAALSEDH